MTATRLRVIECGRTSLDYELAVTGHPDFLMRQSTPDRQQPHRWLHHPIYTYVIDHPDGRVLVDTAVSPNFERHWRHPFYPDVMGYKNKPANPVELVCLLRSVLDVTAAYTA